MRYPNWSGGWGNLNYACSAAFIALMWGKTQPAGSLVSSRPRAGALGLLRCGGSAKEGPPRLLQPAEHDRAAPSCVRPPPRAAPTCSPLPPPQLRTESLQFALHTAQYSLGGFTWSGFVVGVAGTNYPKQASHPGASCPNLPAPCSWPQFSAAGPNPQVLHGALVGGPTGPGDNTFDDSRANYYTTEPAVDYNAGYTGLLAGLLQIAITIVTCLHLLNILCSTCPPL